MKRILLVMLPLLFIACGPNSVGKNEQKDKSNEFDATTGKNNTELPGKEAEETADLEYATFYVVIADTNSNYYLLHKKMFDLNQKLNIPIDTMGRFFDKAKNLIALPENDEDEMYAGDYFPRRFPSDNLSLEYLDFYQKQTTGKTIALVTGIHETEKSADSALTVLNSIEKKAYKIKATIYVGCMH